MRSHRRHLRLLSLEDRTTPVAGELDPTFGSGGIVTTAIGTSEDHGYGVAVQPDGKVIVGGHSWNGTDWDFSVARFNANGALDPTFDGDGRAITNFGIQHDTAYALMLQPDGKIVLAGYAWNGSNYDFALVRYNPNGSLDTGFSGDGRATMAIGTEDDTGNAVALQSDGKIVVAGERWSGVTAAVAVARFNADGTPDLTFGPGGKVVTNYVSGDERVNRVAINTIAGEERIVAIGRTGAGVGENVGLVRLKPDGTLDTSFDGDGKLSLDINARQDAGGAVIGLADGSLLVGGHAYNGSNYDFFVAKLTTAGILDSTFGGGDGKVINDLAGPGDSAQGFAVQPNGRIIATGFTGDGVSDDFAVVRYLANGDLDLEFGGTGIFTSSIDSGNDRAFGVAIATDGSIIVGGETYNGLNLDLFAARLLANTEPSLGSTSSGITFTENSAPVVLDAGLTPANPDGTTLGGAAVRIGNYVRGEDVLNFTTVPGIASSFDDALGVLTFTGTATIADYQALLRSVAYQNVSDGPSVFPRTVSFTVNDGAGHSNLSPTIVLNVSIVAENDAPSFTDDGLVPAILQGNTDPAGRKISSIFAGLFGDPDQGDSLAGVAAIMNLADSGSEGTWQYSTDNGTTWFDVGSLAGDSAASLVLASSTRVRFVPVPAFSGEPTPLIVRAIDETFAGAFTIGATRETIDTSTIQGGTTPIADDTTTIDATVWPFGTSGNTPPTLGGVPVSASISEGQSLSFTATTSDPDVGQTLSFGLDGAPATASIDPDSGEFSWATTEADGPGTFVFNVQVSDGFAITEKTITVIVAELNTTPILAGVPTSALLTRGEPLTFAASSNDDDLLNGLPNTRTFSLVGAPSDASIHPDTGVFSWIPADSLSPGTYIFDVRVADDGTPSMSATATIAITVQDAYLLAGNLVVGGTAGNDTITVTPTKDLSQLIVKLGKTNLGTFTAAQVNQIIVRGLGGNDKITVHSKISKPADLYGGFGNDALAGGSGDDRLFGEANDDKLSGGKGKNLLVGGSGNDKLTGGKDRDVLIGGAGSDKLAGGGGLSDDLLIGGSTSFDTDLTGLTNILAAWNSAATYEERIDTLQPGGVLNGTTQLSALTVQDTEKDILAGAAGLDWFVASSLDKLDLKPGELPALMI